MTGSSARRGAVLALALLLAACGAPAGSAGTPAGSAGSVGSAPATGGSGVSASASPAGGSPASPADGASASPDGSPPGSPGAVASPSPATNPAAEALAGRAWANLPLTDVTTGETFTIAGLAGRPVFVEAMAIWCTNCRQQQARFSEAFAQLPPGHADYVVLTVDPSESAEELARYEARHGFTGRYAVAARELATALEAEFGPNVLNPPSVPVVFVSPSGEVSFSTGPESVQEILERAGA